MREAVLFERVFEAGRVRAFGKPDPGRLEPEKAARRATPDAQLRVDRCAVQEWQITMCRSRGEDLDVPAAREIGERADEIAPEPSGVGLAKPTVGREIEVGERSAARVAGVDETADVLFRAADLVVDVLEIANVDVVIRELLEQHRREADDDPVGDARIAQVVKEAEQREVGAEHGLVDPLLAVRPPASPTTVGEVRVQGENKGSHSWHSVARADSGHVVSGPLPVRALRAPRGGREWPGRCSACSVGYQPNVSKDKERDPYARACH